MSTQSDNSESADNKERRFTSFSEFYPYYLSEHRNSTCRSLHYIGSSIGLGILLFALTSGSWSVGVPGIYPVVWLYVDEYG